VPTAQERSWCHKMNRSMMQRRRRLGRRKGFTLLEVLLVVVILAVIAGIVVVNIFSTQDEAFKKLAQSQVSAISNSLKQYRLLVGSYPSSLSALHEKPSDLADGSKWSPVLEKPVSPDPWGRPYEYKLNGNTFEIRCLGPDGQSGTEDDIVN
jgi:general secretion pathway protein G